MHAVATSHIWLDDQGVAWIDDTNVKVIEVALDRVAYGWSPEEIQRQDPGLSIGQVYAALSYYYDHQQEFDNEIGRQVEEVRALATQAGDSPLKKRLRGLGKLP